MPLWTAVAQSDFPVKEAAAAMLTSGCPPVQSDVPMKKSEVHTASQQVTKAFSNSHIPENEAGIGDTAPSRAAIDKPASNALQSEAEEDQQQPEQQALATVYDCDVSMEQEGGQQLVSHDAPIGPVTDNKWLRPYFDQESADAAVKSAGTMAFSDEMEETYSRGLTG